MDTLNLQARWEQLSLQTSQRELGMPLGADEGAGGCSPPVAKRAVPAMSSAFLSTWPLVLRA